MLNDLAHWLGWTPAWCREVCDYYRVTPSEALRLGTRAPGRRPALPGSPTCAPVSGRTWDDLWAREPRDTDAAVAAFWQDVGSWCTFRQVVRNRRRSFAFIGHRLGMMDAFCEYGAGVAPASWWLVRHAPVPLRLTLVDVPSEHLTFGAWRLQCRLEAEWDLCCWEARALATQETRPLSASYRGIAVLEVLEHLPHPLQTVQHLVEHLEPAGWLWEDFFPHADAHGADLPQAQAERPAVYAYLQETCDLVEGRSWETPDGGGTRTWRRR